jgi:hypothetical protein
MELGYHFGQWMSFGILATVSDGYTTSSSLTSYGAVLRLHAQIEGSTFYPYLHASAVSNSEPKAAIATTAGVMIPLFSRFILRPELGLAWIRAQKSAPEGFGNQYYTAWDYWYTAALIIEIVI